MPNIILGISFMFIGVAIGLIRMLSMKVGWREYTIVMIWIGIGFVLFEIGVFTSMYLGCSTAPVL